VKTVKKIKYHLYFSENRRDYPINYSEIGEKHLYNVFSPIFVPYLCETKKKYDISPITG